MREARVMGTVRRWLKPRTERGRTGRSADGSTRGWRRESDREVTGVRVSREATPASHPRPLGTGDRHSFYLRGLHENPYPQSTVSVKGEGGVGNRLPLDRCCDAQVVRAQPNGSCRGEGLAEGPRLRI